MQKFTGNKFKIRCGAALLLGALLLLSASQAGAEENPFGFAIHAEPARVEAGGRFRIHLEITFGGEYQLYADQTSLTPLPSEGVRFDKVQADEPTIKNDPYLGKIGIHKSPVHFTLPGSIDEAVNAGARMLSFRLKYQACTQNSCLMPEEKIFEVPIEVLAASAEETVQPLISEERRSDSAVENAFQRTATRFGLIGVIFMAIGLGFLSSLTPCVYPMIPVTISVVASKSGGNVGRGFLLSVVYVLGMSLTYAIFGVAAAMSGSLFGAYAGHPVVRWVVAGIFILMALGMFDILFVQTPSAITHRINGRFQSGLWGVFLTGSASGAVVGPCVGPIMVSLLLYIAESGSVYAGFVIMWCFALGMGVLFLVIGTFSGAATALPRAGLWMEKIKQLFGFVMLALALVYLKPVLSVHVFQLLVIALTIGAGIFLGSLWPFDTMGFGFKRAIRGGWLVMVILLIAMGFRWLIGLEPGVESLENKPGIQWLRDEERALSMARETGKPVMIDFYADWCAACKQLDRGTFKDAAVLRESEGFVNLKIDATDPENPAIKSLLKKYKVVGLPTVLFIGPDGNPAWDKTFTACVPPETLVRRMIEIKSGK